MRRDSTLFGIVTISSVPVSAMRGMRIPLLPLFTSSMAPIVGSDPSLLIATFCAAACISVNKDAKADNKKYFLIMVDLVVAEAGKELCQINKARLYKMRGQYNYRYMDFFNVCHVDPERS